MDALEVNGGSPGRAKEQKWPAWPLHDDGERSALLRVLDSGKWWYGDEVATFEKEFAAFQGAAHCVSCTSGTTALEVALRALDVGPGHEVIVPAYTFIATASAVTVVGAAPVFVDVDESWCIDPDRVAEAVTPRTKAVIPVHFGSCMADMDRLRALAEAEGFVLVEDACHAWGSQWEGEGAGTLGACGAFSFQASKNLTAGEGGAIVTQDDALAERCRSITNCGRVTGETFYQHQYAGTNARMTEFSAAVLRAQLSRLEVQTLRRAENAALLTEGIALIEGLTPQPGSNRETRRAYHLYCIRFDGETFGCEREPFLKAVQAEGLPLNAGYAIPLYDQPMYTEEGVPHTAHACPVTEELCARTGTFFLHTVLLGDEDDMRDIIAILEKVKAHVASLRS